MNPVRRFLRFVLGIAFIFATASGGATPLLGQSECAQPDGSSRPNGVGTIGVRLEGAGDAGAVAAAVQKWEQKCVGSGPDLVVGLPGDFPITVEFHAGPRVGEGGNTCEISFLQPSSGTIIGAAIHIYEFKRDGSPCNVSPADLIAHGIGHALGFRDIIPANPEQFHVCDGTIMGRPIAGHPYAILDDHCSLLEQRWPENNRLRGAALMPEFNYSQVELGAEYSREGIVTGAEVIFVHESGDFAFGEPLSDGTSFSVSLSAPNDLDCFLHGSSGVISGRDGQVFLSCLRKIPSLCDKWGQACSDQGYSDPSDAPPDLPWPVYFNCGAQSIAGSTTRVPCGEVVANGVTEPIFCDQVTIVDVLTCTLLGGVTGAASQAPFTVDGPEVALLQPAAGVTVAGLVAVKGWASHPEGTLDGVGVWLDGQPVALQGYQSGLYAPEACGGAAAGCNPYVGFHGYLDTAGLAKGAHEIMVMSVANEAGRPGMTSVKRTVLVDQACATTAPQVTITSPAEGATVGSTVTVTAHVSSPYPLHGVFFSVDGESLSWDAQPPYAVNWNTAAAQIGEHAITARAINVCNVSATSPSRRVVLKDSTAPTVALTLPAAGALLRATVRLRAQALDNVAVSRVEFFANGAMIGSDTSSPYEVTWNTAATPDGAYSLLARAYDSASNAAATSPLSVKVDNTAPKAYIDVPGGGAVVSGSGVQLMGWATDASRIAGLSFKLNGLPLALNVPYTYGYYRADVCSAIPGDPGCPYVGWGATFDSRSLPNGTHTVAVTVADSAGLTVVVQRTFTIGNPTSDVTPPKAYIDAPGGGAVVSGLAVAIEGWATDSSKIARLAFALDGQTLALTAPYTYGLHRGDVCSAIPGDPSCPYVGWRAYFDSTQASNGPHRVDVTVTDFAGLQSVTSRTFEVVNLPSLRLVQDWDGVTVPSGTSLVFPTTPPGSIRSRRYRLYNDGAVPLLLHNRGSFVSGSCFSASELPPVEVSPGASSYFSLQMFSMTAATCTGAIALQSNDPDDSPFEISLQGTVYGAMRIDPQILVVQNWDGAGVLKWGTFAFPSQPVGSPVSRVFAIRNESSATLTIGNPTSLVSGSCFSQIDAAPASTVAAGAETYFRVRFYCGSAGTYAGTVSIVSDDPDDNPFSFTIQGTAY